MQTAQVLTPEKLKEAREELGLSRTALAGRMGVDYLSVRRWEQPGVQITRLVELAFMTVAQQLIEERQREEAEDGREDVGGSNSVRQEARHEGHGA